MTFQNWRWWLSDKWYYVTMFLAYSVVMILLLPVWVPLSLLMTFLEGWDDLRFHR